MAPLAPFTPANGEDVARKDRRRHLVVECRMRRVGWFLAAREAARAGFRRSRERRAHSGQRLSCPPKRYRESGPWICRDQFPAADAPASKQQPDHARGLTGLLRFSTRRRLRRLRGAPRSSGRGVPQSTGPHVGRGRRQLAVRGVAHRLRRVRRAVRPAGFTSRGRGAEGRHSSARKPGRLGPPSVPPDPLESPGIPASPPPPHGR